MDSRLTRSTSRESILSSISKVGGWEVGDRCNLDGRIGTVSFIGTTNFASGEWIGITLGEPTGKNDGSMNGQRYFTCDANHGVFCKASKLSRISSTRKSLPRSENPFAKEFGIDVGDRVVVSGGKIGTVRFLGTADFQDGVWVGIELDYPVGKNDGSVKDKRYFTCEAPHGLFALASKVTRIPNHSLSRIQMRHTKTSALRQQYGSQESLASFGASSIASSRMSKYSFAVPKKIQRPLVISSSRDVDQLVNTLKESMEEKEKHLEQILKEQDIERNEMARITNHCELLEAKLGMHECKAETESSSNSSLVRESVLLRKKVSELEAAVQDLHAKLKEKTENAEEQSFLLEEKDIMCSELNERLSELSKTSDEKEIRQKRLMEEIETLKNELVKSDVSQAIFAAASSVESGYIERTAQLQKSIPRSSETELLMATKKDETKCLLDENNREAEGKFQNLLQEFNKLTETHATCDNILRSHQETLESRKNEVENLLDTISRLEDQTSKLTGEIGRLTALKSEIEQDLQLSCANVKNLEDTVAESGTEMLAMKEKISSYEQEINRCKAQSVALEEHLVKWKESKFDESAKLEAAFKSEMAILESKIMESTKRINAQSVTIERLSGENGSKSERIKELEENLNSHIHMSDKLQEKYVSLENELEKLEQIREAQKMAKDNLNGEMVVAQTRIYEFENMIRTNESHKQLLEGMKTAQESELSGFMEKIADLSTENERLNEANISSAAVATNLRKEKSELEAKLFEANGCIETSIKELSSLRAVNVKQNEFNENLKARNLDLKAKLSEANESIDVSVKEVVHTQHDLLNQELKAKNLDLEAKLAEEKKSFEASIKQLDNLKALNLQQGNSKMQWQHELERLSEEISRLQKLLESTENNNAVLRKSYEQMKDSECKVKTENENLKNEISQFIEQCANLKSEIDAHSTSLSKLNSDKARLADQILHLNVEIEELKSDKAAVDLNLQNSEKKVNSSETQVREFTDQCTQLLTANCALESRLEDAKANSEMIDANEKQLLKRIDALTMEVSNASGEKSLNASEFIKLTAQLDDSYSNLKLSQDTVDKLRNEVNELQTDNFTSKNSLDACKEELATVQMDLSFAHESYEKCKAELDAVTSKMMNRIQDEHINNYTEAVCLRDENTRLKNDLKCAANELTVLRSRISEQENSSKRDEGNVKGDAVDAAHAELEIEWNAKERKYLMAIEELKTSNRTSTTCESVSELNQQIDFLNSIIASQHTKESELRDQIDILLRIPVAETLNALDEKHRKVLRPYCDTCEAFDLHDTCDCPSTAMEAFDYESHSHHRLDQPLKSTRPYCDVCEVFLHDTADCPSKNGIF